MTLIILFRTPCSDYHSPAGHLLAFSAQGQLPGSSPGVAPRDVNDLVMINPNYPPLRSWACDAGCWLGLRATNPEIYHCFHTHRGSEGSRTPPGPWARIRDSWTHGCAHHCLWDGNRRQRGQVTGASRSCLAQVSCGKRRLRFLFLFYFFLFFISSL